MENEPLKSSNSHFLTSFQFSLPNDDQCLISTAQSEDLLIVKAGPKGNHIFFVKDQQILVISLHLPLQLVNAPSHLQEIWKFNTPLTSIACSYSKLYVLAQDGTFGDFALPSQTTEEPPSKKRKSSPFRPPVSEKILGTGEPSEGCGGWLVPLGTEGREGEEGWVRGGGLLPLRISLGGSPLRPSSHGNEDLRTAFLLADPKGTSLGRKASQEIYRRLGGKGAVSESPLLLLGDSQGILTRLRLPHGTPEEVGRLTEGVVSILGIPMGAPMEKLLVVGQRGGVWVLGASPSQDLRGSIGTSTVISVVPTTQGIVVLGAEGHIWEFPLPMGPEDSQAFPVGRRVSWPFSLAVTSWKGGFATLTTRGKLLGFPMGPASMGTLGTALRASGRVEGALGAVDSVEAHLLALRRSHGNFSAALPSLHSLLRWIPRGHGNSGTRGKGGLPLKVTVSRGKEWSHGRGDVEVLLDGGNSSLGTLGLQGWGVWIHLRGPSGSWESWVFPVSQGALKTSQWEGRVGPQAGRVDVGVSLLRGCPEGGSVVPLGRYSLKAVSAPRGPHELLHPHPPTSSPGTLTLPVGPLGRGAMGSSRVTLVGESATLAELRGEVLGTVGRSIERPYPSLSQVSEKDCEPFLRTLHTAASSADSLLRLQREWGSFPLSHGTPGNFHGPSLPTRSRTAQQLFRECQTLYSHSRDILNVFPL